jgi:hypothetical protein
LQQLRACIQLLYDLHSTAASVLSSSSSNPIHQ